MLDAVLIFPPLANPFYPYLSTPTLAACLQEVGRTVEQRDLNLELYDYLFTTDYLQSFEKELQEKIEKLESLPELTWKQQEELTQLICLNIALNNLNNDFDLTPEQVKSDLRDLNSYRYENNKPVLLDSWRYFNRLNTLLSYLISPLQLPVCDTKSISRVISGEEYYFYYRVLQDKFVPDILKSKPKMVGISITYQTQVIPGLVLGYLLKQHDPSIHLCIGGQHLSTISRDIEHIYPELPFVDSISINEGENTIVKMLDYLDGKANIEEIPNLFYRKDGQVSQNRSEVIKDINNSPLPDFSGLPLDKYFTGELVLPYAASKGCYYNKCTFCSFPYISPRYRIKSPEEVALEIKALSEKYGTRLFYLTNEADPPKRIKQLSEEIIKLDLDIFYHSFCRFDRKVDREMVKLLAESGCKVLFFGLEAASNRINELMMNKGISLETARKILKDCDEHHIFTVVSSIIGFPGETPQEALATKDFLENYSYYKNHVPQSHDFRLPRGTDTEINHQKYGVKKLYRNEGNLSTILSNYETSYPRFTKEESEQARIKHETVDFWPHHDCIDLIYAEYYDGKIPVIFSYDRELISQKNVEVKKNLRKNCFNYESNRHSFEELIRRKELRLELVKDLYRQGYHYEEIENIISGSILGKNLKQYEFSFVIEVGKIREFVNSCKSSARDRGLVQAG